MKYRYVCLLLALLTVGSQFAGCSGEEPAEMENNTVVAETAVETETELHDNVPDQDFGGNEYTMTAPVNTSFVNYIYMAPEELTGEPINDAFYNRNLLIGERFNVAISEQLIKESDYYTTVQKNIQAGDAVSDLVFPQVNGGSALAVGGFLLNLNGFPVVDLTMPWWNQNSRQNLMVEDRLYFTQNDIPTTSVVMENHILFFNENIAEENGLPNLYDMVREGTWTLDVMLELMNGIGQDLDGDGAMKGGTDLFGFTGSFGSTEVFLPGVNQYIIQPDDNGSPKYVLMSEKMVSVVEKLYAMAYESNEALVGPINLEADFAQYFIEGLSLFYSGFVFDCDIFRDMEDSFGILPPPKYDTAQKDYNTKVRAPNMLVGIPTTVPESEYDFVGSVTEALACESYLTVRGIVYETVLKNKYLRNVDSEEMLDLVTRNIGIDLGYVYAPWNLRFPVWQILEKKSKDFASFYASNEKNAIAELEKAIEALTKNEN